jgi:hypothetical protein
MSDNLRTEDLSQYARIMASISDTPGIVSKLTQIADRLDEQQDRIKRLEDENDALRADLLLWNEKEVKL